MANTLTKARCARLPNRREGGLAMVEFVIVAATIFVPLLYGVISVGLRYYQHNTLTNATQVAGRYYAMHCVEAGHGDAYNGAYGGALALLNANIQSLRVKDGGNLTSPTVGYVSNRTTVNGFAADLTTSCGTQASSCGPTCVFIQFSSPKAGSTYVFGTWTDTSPITVTQRILR